MQLLETFGPLLPYLRRFSRALTGSQASGDTYVRAALQALSTGDVSIDANLAPKVALYQMFLGIWNSSGAMLERFDDDTDSPDDKVRKLTPLPRQAFLLQALEGLNISQIAQVMKINEEKAAAYVAEAEADIDKELRTNVLIIEDEAFIAADIEGLVTELGHKVDAIVATHKEAIKAVSKVKPGLILADIQLADGSSGIEAVGEILEQYDIPVIFITAFPERLLTGDKPEPAYLIAKPFDPSNVKAAISQALFFHE